MDQLLETLIEPSVPETTPVPPENCQDEFKPIPRKLSFLHVSLPSAHNDVTEEMSSAKPNLICNTVTQLLHSPEKLLSRRAELQRKLAANNVDNQHNTSQQKEQKEVKPTDLTSVSKENVPVSSNFKPDSPELERNTSPCKGIIYKPITKHSITNFLIVFYVCSTLKVCVGGGRGVIPLTRETNIQKFS